MNFDRMKEKKIRAGVICCVLWKQTGRKIFKKYPHKISATITAAPRRAEPRTIFMKYVQKIGIQIKFVPM